MSSIATDERKWNKLSNTMQQFHNYLQNEYESLYELADGSFNSRGMSLKDFMRTALEFCSHLETHHGIEERYIFPILGERMPEFQDNDKHKSMHKGIHDGLDRVKANAKTYLEDPTAYSPDEFRATLDSFRDILYTHLQQEVIDLKGENLKKYWKLEDLDRLPMH